jgi:mRNA interferase RelE/StbE
MPFEIVFAPEAVEDWKRLDARDRATLKEALEVHLRFEPQKESKSRIKRLRGMARPQYRLRVDQLRIFYDVTDETVEVLAVITKADANDWLEQFGELDGGESDETSTAQ